MRFSKVIIGAGILTLVITGSHTIGVAALIAQSARNISNQASNIPETPGNFRIVGRTGSQLKLDWDWVAGGTGAIHYELSYGGQTLVLPQYYPGYTADISNLDLGAGNTYTFNLRAVDSAGNRSAVPAQLIFETTPPTRPSNLIQLSTKMDYPDLISFSLSTDTASPIRGYEVFLGGVSFGIAQGTDNEFSLFDQVSTAYLPTPTGPTDLQLRAFDSSFNNSQLSEPLTVVFPSGN